MELSTPITAIKTEYECDACRNGLMRPTGETLTTTPVRYKHRCTSCSAEAAFTTRYPRIDYNLVPTLVL
jgi:hypothetical protein